MQTNWKSYGPWMVFFCIFGGSLQSQPERWIPSWNKNQTNLVCDVDCNYDKVNEKPEYDKCCTCGSSPIWMVDTTKTLTELLVEYITVTGRSALLNETPTILDLLLANHTHGQMAHLPENMCDFRGIVTIDFSYNTIFKLTKLSCLTELDTIILKNNHLTHLSNTSFTGLSQLRKLDVSHNNLKAMDSAILFSGSIRPFCVDVGFNQLETVDITNMISDSPYCSIDYTSNKINDLTNDKNITLDHSKTYGPGVTTFQDNNFSEFPNVLKILNMNSLAELGQFTSFGFQFAGAPIYCDCHMEPYAALVADLNPSDSSIWRDYFNVTCKGPPEMKGMTVEQALIDLDKFVCHLGVEQGCPLGCSCVDQPSLEALKVNCSGAGLTKLPDTLPMSEYSPHIHLDISNNSITVVESRTYLSLVSRFEASNNEIVSFPETSAALLKNVKYLNFSNNAQLTIMPENIQYFNPCGLTLPGILDCNCDKRWINVWQNLKQCNSSYTCRLPSGKTVPASSDWPDELRCNDTATDWTPLIVTQAILTVLLAAVSIALYNFRYEIAVIYLQLRRKDRSAVAPLYPFDVFLSFDDEDVILRKWVIGCLLPLLEHMGYRVFSPVRDMAGGCVRDEETIAQLRQTRNFLLILSESYLRQEGHVWTDNEWKYAWNMYKENSNKRVIIVNYDHIYSWDVNHPQIRAFLRVGRPIDFSNREGNIIEDIATRLGALSGVRQSFENRKPIFVSKPRVDDVFLDIQGH